MASLTPPTGALEALTSFVGREAELRDVVELVGDSRLVTIVGPGGVGKTRFARRLMLTVAAQFPEAPTFIDLTAVQGDDRVVAAILQSLGGQLRHGNETEAAAALVGERRLLLVLDNCEQVISGAADAAQRLLLGCPELHLLATSREPLAVPGEALYRLMPLPVPVAGETSATNSSVELFIDRARAVQHGFAMTEEAAAAVVSICRAVDGIPLAIELAAARVRTLPVEQLASRMAAAGLGVLAGGPRTAPERHRTMRATIAWSVESLPPAERTLFQRLAVFTGGWTLEAAEGACAGSDVQRDSVLDLLESLADRSLVVGAAEGGRFRFLEPILEYAREELVDSGQADDVGAAHCRWFRQLAAAAEPHLRAHGSAYWLEVLGADNDNLHAALAWAAAHEAQINDGLHLAADLRWYVSQRALESEYFPLTTRLVTAPFVISARARLPALLAHSWNAQGVGELDEGERSATEAYEIASELGDELWMARAKHLWGLALSYRGADDEASAIWEDALRLAESSGSGVDIGLMLTFLGMPSGPSSSTRPLLERALGLLREAGWEMGQVMAGGQLAACMQVEGDLAGAERQALVVFDLCRKIGSPRHASLTAIVISVIRIQRGHHTGAYPLLREGLEVAIRIGATSRYRIAVTAAAALEATTGDAALAARWLGGIDADQFALYYEDRPLSDLAFGAAQSKLGERFEVEFRRGQAATSEQTAREVLAKISASVPLSQDEPTGRLRLTAREAEVLRLVAAGTSNREIAETLVLSTRTVETHIANVYSKIGVQNRVEATRWAMEAGLAANT